VRSVLEESATEMRIVWRRKKRKEVSWRKENG
jgi:hypothetical protein